MAGSGQVRSYAELDERSARLANGLHSVGVGVGVGAGAGVGGGAGVAGVAGTVALISENRLEWAEIVWATQRSGICLAPISPTTPTEVLRALLDECRVDTVITTARYADGVAAAVRGLARSVPLLVMDGGEHGSDYASVLAAASAAPPADERLGSRMMFTSGTTGRPKAIRHPARDVHPAEAGPHLGGYTDLFELTPDTVYLSPAPAYHVAPLRFLIAVQQLGGTVVMMERFAAGAALEAMPRWRVSHAQFVPTMLSRMLALPGGERDRHDLSSLRVAITGAAPCPVSVKRAIADWWGPVLHELYGTSESYGGCHINPLDGLARPGSVGSPVTGRVHITASEGPGDGAPGAPGAPGASGGPGAELPVGQVGQIWFEGGARFSYLGDDAKTAASRNDLGWTSVGDLGRVDGDGYLYLAGRRDDLIISGGVNVHPAAAEDALAERAEVAEVCVLGLPDADLGERVCAVVVLAAGSTPDRRTSDELLAHCRARAGRSGAAREIRFVTELPRGDTGKVNRAGLRAQLTVPAPGA
jgi:fatty-acyl-CoA synthase